MPAPLRGVPAPPGSASSSEEASPPMLRSLSSSAAAAVCMAISCTARDSGSCGDVGLSPRSPLPPPLLLALSIEWASRALDGRGTPAAASALGTGLLPPAAAAPPRPGPEDIAGCRAAPGAAQAAVALLSAPSLPRSRRYVTCGEADTMGCCPRSAAAARSDSAAARAWLGWPRPAATAAASAWSARKETSSRFQ